LIESTSDITEQSESTII